MFKLILELGLNTINKCKTKKKLQKHSFIFNITIRYTQAF